MLLQKVFTSSRIKTDLESSDKDELFEEMVDLLVRSEGRQFPRAAVLDALRNRERKMTTGIKKGIALPHGKAEGVQGLVGAIGLSRSGVDYDAMDGEPVFLVCMLVSSPKDSELHLQALKSIARLLGDPDFYTELLAADTPERAFAVIKSFEDMLSMST
ncbi:MAG: PTS sugar transporter subunit IIA [Spirochaetes bacterium]|nr:PTS sugar transporter subunit IIA [Spirochaetota bacterium]